MIFSPVTAGLYSLNILGRMVVAWISITSRTIELLARIISPMTPAQRMGDAVGDRRHTVDVPSGHALMSELTPPTVEGQRSQSGFDLRGRLGMRRGSDPGPQRSIGPVVLKTETEPETEPHTEKFQNAPIH